MRLFVLYIILFLVSNLVLVNYNLNYFMRRVIFDYMNEINKGLFIGVNFIYL